MTKTLNEVELGYKSFLKTIKEDTVSADIAQATSKMPMYKKCAEDNDEDCTVLKKDTENTEDELSESPVFTPGRPGFKDVEDYINDIPNLRAHLRKLLKQVGGKTVLLKLIDQLNSNPENA